MAEPPGGGVGLCRSVRQDRCQPPRREGVGIPVGLRGIPVAWTASTGMIPPRPAELADLAAGLGMARSPAPRGRGLGGGFGLLRSEGFPASLCQPNYPQPLHRGGEPSVGVHSPPCPPVSPVLPLRIVPIVVAVRPARIARVVGVRGAAVVGEVGVRGGRARAGSRRGSVRGRGIPSLSSSRRWRGLCRRGRLCRRGIF